LSFNVTLLLLEAFLSLTLIGIRFQGAYSIQNRER
jgi:hypothetical protein